MPRGRRFGKYVNHERFCVRTKVWTAWGAVVVGVIIIVQSREHPGLTPSISRPGREWAAVAAVDSENTYSDDDEGGNDAELVTTATSGLQKAAKSVTSEAGMSP